MFLAAIWLLRGRTYELMGSVSKVSKLSVLRLRESFVLVLCLLLLATSWLVIYVAEGHLGFMAAQKEFHRQVGSNLHKGRGGSYLIS